VVDVLDVRSFLGAPPAERSPATRLLVLGRDRVELALVADAVTGLVAVELGALRPPAESAARVRPEYVRGVAPDGLAVLDGRALLLDPRLVVDGAPLPPEET
jgi:purine-binding chemotaxis protein CheW